MGLAEALRSSELRALRGHPDPLTDRTNIQPKEIDMEPLPLPPGMQHEPDTEPHRPTVVLIDEVPLLLAGITGHGKTSVAKLMKTMRSIHRYDVRVEDGRG